MGGCTRWLEWSTIQDHPILVAFSPIFGLKVWDVDTLQCQTINLKTRTNFPVMQMSNSGSLLAIADYKDVLVCDIQTGELFVHEEVRGWKVVRWGPGDDKLAVIDDHHRILVLDMNQ